MARTTAVLLLLAILGLPVMAEAQRVNLPRCNVGADPVNRNRQPTDNEEVATNPADQVITMKSGNGHDVTCILQAGVPVVVDKQTGVALWVYGCGNDITSPPWIPKRRPSFSLRGEKGDPGPQGPPGPVGAPAPQLDIAALFAAMNTNRAPAPKKLGFWCFRGWKEGLGCTAMVGGAVLIGHELSNKKKPDPPKHEEQVHTRPPCTSLPCN